MKSIILFAKLLLGVMGGWFAGFHFHVATIDTARLSQEMVAKIQQFETAFSYPFSPDEQFTIKHGQAGDYFAFFKGLGDPYCFVVTSKRDRKVGKIIDGKKTCVHQKAGEVAAMATAVLRTMKNEKNMPIRAWYICDLKVNKKYQGEHLPHMIMQKVALKRFIQCRRGFAICMNPPRGEPKAAAIFKKHGPITLKTQTLNLYTLTAQQMQAQGNRIQESLIRQGYMEPDEALGFKSTAGIKDYEIFNAHKRRPWHLLHIQRHATAIGPQQGATHMLCAVEGTMLDDEFKNIVGAPSSTAQIISHGMEDVDFNVLTTDQI